MFWGELINKIKSQSSEFQERASKIENNKASVFELEKKKSEVFSKIVILVQDTVYELEVNGLIRDFVQNNTNKGAMFRIMGNLELGFSGILFLYTFLRVDENLNIYVVDAAADSMFKYSSNGALLQTLGPVNPEVKELTLTSDILENIYSDSLSGIPVLQNSIEIWSISENDTIFLLNDNGMGRFVGWAGIGNVDYETGAFSLTFND
ncbi:MAG: hypothetical protein IIB07_11030, partial [Bacteroidetes bacterium]|nr:hypothetical protein [Bacteroidota bacterium]